MSIQEWPCRAPDGARSHGQAQFHFYKLLEDLGDRRKQANPCCEELRRNLAAAMHHVLSRRRYTESFLIEFNRQPVVHAQNIAVVFAAIGDPVFAQQGGVDVVPPRFRIGEDAVEIEDYCANRHAKEKVEITKVKKSHPGSRPAAWTLSYGKG